MTKLKAEPTTLYCPECGRLRVERMSTCPICHSTIPARKLYPITATRVRTRYASHLAAEERREQEKADYIALHGKDAWNAKVDADIALMYPRT